VVFIFVGAKKALNRKWFNEMCRLKHGFFALERFLKNVKLMAQVWGNLVNKSNELIVTLDGF
jgi:hypothetical protein